MCSPARKQVFRCLRLALGGWVSWHREGGNDPLGARLLSSVLRADAWEAGNKVLCHSHCVLTVDQHYVIGFLSGIIRQNWNDTEKISMAPAQG